MVTGSIKGARRRGTPPARTAESGGAAEPSGAAASAPRRIGAERRHDTGARGRDNLRFLIDHAPDGLVVLDEFGHVTDVSARSCEMLGYARAELLGMRLEDFELDLRAADTRGHLTRNGAASGDRFFVHGRHRRKDGSVYPVDVHFTAVATPTGWRTINFISDVSERERLADVAARNGRRFQKLFDASPDALLVVRRDRIQLANAAAVRLLHAASADELVDLYAYEIIPAYEHEPLRRRARRVVAGATTPVIEHDVCCMDGAIRPVESTVTLIGDDEDGQAVLAILRDISERRAMEAAVLEAVDDGRRQLARELHDDLGQRLTGVTLIAELLARQLGREGHAQAAVADRLRGLLVDTVDGARRLAHGLMPRELQDGGLVDALRALGAQIAAGGQVRWRMRTIGDGAQALPANIAVHLYRIAQEATTNAIRHGAATRVFVTLVAAPHQLRLVVSDDGRGMDADAAVDGLGMQAMRYRAHALGGTLALEARRGGGTRLVCRCALRRAKPVALRPAVTAVAS